MGFSLLKTRFAQEALGRSLAWYLRLVRRTNRFVTEPADIYERVRPELPLYEVDPDLATVCDECWSANCAETS